MADTLQPEPEMKALSGGIPLDDNVEDLIPEEDGTSSPAAKKKPKDRRRRASVMEMIDEVGAASTKDTSGRVNSIERAGFDLLCEKMGLHDNTRYVTSHVMTFPVRWTRRRQRPPGWT